MGIGHVGDADGRLRPRARPSSTNCNALGAMCNPGCEVVHPATERSDDVLAKDLAGVNPRHHCFSFEHRSGPNQALGWDPKVPVQVSDHVDGEAAFSVEHFIHAIDAADVRNEILHGQTGLLHAEPDRLDGIGRLDRKVPRFVSFDQRREDLVNRSDTFEA
ncbi:MAG: hypothetical protein KGJ32_01075 [Xanthomonadaceae bacterium]|nr:hypothetical protein [Xanthomonadaceae bacterium]